MVPVDTEAQFSLLQPDPKKGSKMGANMEPFGLPNPNYTHFGPPFLRNWCQKKLIFSRSRKNEPGGIRFRVFLVLWWRLGGVQGSLREDLDYRISEGALLRLGQSWKDWRGGYLTALTRNPATVGQEPPETDISGLPF